MLLLMVFAVVGAIMLLRIQRRTQKQALGLPAIGMSLLAILLGIFHIWSSLTHEDLPAEAVEHVSVGECLGREVDALLPEGGRVLLIHHTSGMTLESYPANESLIRGLKKALRRSSVELMVDTITPEIGELWERSSAGTGLMTPEIMEAYLEAFPAPDLIVSLMGLPDCAPDVLPQPLPAFVVLGEFEDGSRESWISSGTLKVLVAGRPNADWSDPFEDKYAVVRF